ncbi:MAG: GH32 C-terminal domain-containing protein [Turicibacter sp.]|nr:GH32 C-terminal domain-containing protein [Turicibacter sp.]
MYSDNSILEVYLNEGAEVFTSRIYNKELDKTLTLSGTGRVELTKWSLEG